jgi:hypothetical protein
VAKELAEHSVLENGEVLEQLQQRKEGNVPMEGESAQHSVLENGEVIE